MSQLIISESKSELNNKIQQHVLLINQLLSKACEENLVVKISTPSKTIGRDGHLECTYYNEIKINLLFPL
jgi:hypothetical protein